MRFAARLVALLLVAGCVNTAAAQFSNQPDKQAGPAAATVGAQGSHRWQVGVRIRALGGPCAGLFGTIPVPNDWPEQQVKLVNEDISPNVGKVTYRNIEGIKQMLFEVPSLPAGETARAVITFEVSKSAITAPEDTSGLKIPKTVPADVRKTLGPSPNIETTNVKIKAFAKQYAAGKESAWDQVRALYDAVRETVKVERGSKLKGAANSLRDGKARYEDVTSLFVACCRSIKVPARMVFVPDDAYAEFYLEDAEGKGHWYPCNVAAAQPEFGGVTTTKPIMQKGDNFRVPEAKDAQALVPEYLTGKGGGGKPEVEFVRRVEVAK